MKSIRKSMIGEYDIVERSRAERDALLDLCHPFTVSARYSFQSEQRLFLVMDFVQGGELYRRVQAEKRLCEEHTRLYAAELVLAVGYIHSRGLIHRDLKGENILFDQGGHLKVTDFGLAKANMGDRATTTTYCGTPVYMAPEQVSGEPYNGAVDWWALGILIFEMLCGHPPFDCPNPVRLGEMIKADDIPFPRDMSPPAKDLIGRLCAKNPALRLGSGPTGEEDVKHHPFFNGIDWTAVLDRKIPMPWVPPAAPADQAVNYKQDKEENPNESLNEDVDIPADAQREWVGFTGTNEELAARRMGDDTTTGGPGPNGKA
jgi:serine/threonine protein kinase